MSQQKQSDPIQNKMIPSDNIQPDSVQQTTNHPSNFNSNVQLPNNQPNLGAQAMPQMQPMMQMQNQFNPSMAQQIPMQQVQINNQMMQQQMLLRQQQMMQVMQQQQQMQQMQQLQQQKQMERIQKKKQRIEELKKLQKYPWPELPENNEKNLDTGGHYQKLMYNCGECCGGCAQCCPCVTCCFISYPFITINQGFQGVYQRFGKYVKTVPAGLHRINPCTDTLSVIDTKMKCIDIRQQWLLTRDNVMILVDAVVYYKIEEPRKVKFFVVSLDQAVTQLAFATMRCVAGRFTFQEILEKRQEIQDRIQSFVDDHVWEWGVVLENVVIKDIKMSKDLQEALAISAREVRLAEGKILSAKADAQAAKLLREAADILDSKSAMQIRYLETIKQLSTTSKVIFYSPDDDKK